MNWSVFMFGVVMLFSVFWYFISGRKVYDGPTVEVDAVGNDTVHDFDKSAGMSGIGMAS